MPNLIFWGAGGAGRETLAKSLVKPDCFVDSDPALWGKAIDGIPVLSSIDADQQFPDATWVVTIHRHFSAAQEVRDHIRNFGRTLGSLADYLPVMDGLPPRKALDSLWLLVKHDEESLDVLRDQLKFRRTKDYDAQIPPDPPEETYFPDFLHKIKNEVFIDCGAADGDTVEQFIQWQPDYKAIIAYEADAANFKKLKRKRAKWRNLTCLHAAVSDHYGKMAFCGDLATASHLSERGSVKVNCMPLDHTDATFIKMDIEGSELEAIWGARKLLREKHPVLAVCAYHTSAHLWELPLLVHAINPDYDLYLRRYAEGARELIWYCVTGDRICPT